MYRQTFKTLAIVVLLGLLLSCNNQDQDTGDGHAGPIAPARGIACDRNQLTSWTGLVTGYQRDEQSIWIEISTDEGSVEQATIAHKGFVDASTHFLLWGEPFTPNNWTAIEATQGNLIDGMRATVWVCADGRTPAVIDWRPDRS